MSISVGIDIAKENFVVSLGTGRVFELPNSEAGIGLLAKRLPAGATVHLEASGGYERLVHRQLESHGFEVRVHNALKARRLAQALSAGAKTDPVDARHLAKAAQLLPTHPAKSAEREALTDHSRAIDALKRMLGDMRKRLAGPGIDLAAKQVYEECTVALAAQCKAAEKAFVKRVKASSFAHRYKLLLSIPGIGPVAARVCLCELPENFDQVSPASIAAYAGVAPLDQSSGKVIGRAHIARGNKRLRTGLYMGALAIAHAEPWAKDCYSRLREAGKSHQVALVAIMRKLLLRVVAVLKRGEPWQPTPLPA